MIHWWWQLAENSIRGSVVYGYLKFIKRTWGIEGLKECVEATGVDPDKIKGGQWYSADHTRKILQWVSDTKGQDYVRKSGNYIVKDLGVLSYIVRFTNIKTLLKKAPDSYSDGFTYGSIKVDIGENSAVIKMKDTAVDDYACPAWLGALSGMLEMTRTKGTVEETQCQRKGAPHCEFLMEWE